jgi:hypothetical protein
MAALAAVPAGKNLNDLISMPGMAHRWRKPVCAIAIGALRKNQWRIGAQRHRALHAGRLVFDRQAEGRTKTGRAAIGTVSVRTERLVIAYIDKLGIDLHPDAVLFRNRSGNPYRADTLSDDFADVRELTFPGDKRRLMDMRRSGVVEAIAGEAGPLGLSAKLANSIERSNTLHKTYAPVDIEAVLNADAARLKGRRKMRRERKRSKSLKITANASLKWQACRPVSA